MNALLTVDELAALLRVHPNTVYKKARNGEIPSVKTSGSRMRFIVKDVQEWLLKRAWTRKCPKLY